MASTISLPPLTHELILSKNEFVISTFLVNFEKTSLLRLLTFQTRNFDAISFANDIEYPTGNYTLILN